MKTRDAGRDALGVMDAAMRTWRPQGLTRRAAHELRRRLHLYERLESRKAPFGDLSLPALPVDRLRAFYDAHPDARAALISEACAIQRGELRYFGGPPGQTTFPPDWHAHPTTGHKWPLVHWTEISDNSAHGDVKWLWEPARFAWAQVLARAYVATGDRSHADALRLGILSFAEQNPAYRGVHWRCGQEVALRAFSLVFAVSLIRDVLSTADLAIVNQLLYDTARRIDVALTYALSQRNNHALSELAGLWLLAHVCPHFPGTKRYKAQVQKHLPQVLSDQFARDGSYIQESLAYHRTALEALSILRWTSRAAGAAPPADLESVFARSATYLAPFVCATTGAVPNLGANDGSLVLALSTCPIKDYRPIIGHAAAAAGAGRAYDEGPWAETTLWLGETLPGLTTGRPPWRTVLHPSGNLCSRREYSRVYFRVPSHTDHRPSHADALHVDLWLGPENIARDPGTYAYTAPPPWQNSLAETRVHNTCSVGRESQMRRHGRFFWSSWNHSSLECHRPLGDADLFWARTTCTPDRAFEHHRLLLHTSFGVLVLDRVHGEREETLRVHWNLPATFHADGAGCFRRQDACLSLAATPTAQLEHTVADLSSELGWHSPTYGQKDPSLAVEMSTRAFSADFFSFFQWRQSEKTFDRALALWDIWTREGPSKTASAAHRLFG